MLELEGGNELLLLTCETELDDEIVADVTLDVASLEEERSRSKKLPPSQAVAPAISELNIKVRRAVRLLAVRTACMTSRSF